MDTSTVDVYVAIDIFLLLLIGVGPKIALLPFLTLTQGMDATARRQVIRTTLTTVCVVSLVLILFGELLRKLLHFSTGALSVAGGLLLLIIAIGMVRGSDDVEGDHTPSHVDDPMKMAVYPLAVPYVLNPVGIVVLVTLSADAVSLDLLAIVVGALALVLAIDALVLGVGGRISGHLDPSRLLLTEKVFGFLLAALAVQLALNGLADVGVVNLTAH